MNKIKIKKGDQVLVIAGENKGSKGAVLKVLYNSNKALVEGVNTVKRHTKPNSENPKGGIIEKQLPIYKPSFDSEEIKMAPTNPLFLKKMKDAALKNQKKAMLKSKKSRNLLAGSRKKRKTRKKKRRRRKRKTHRRKRKTRRRR